MLRCYLKILKDFCHIVLIYIFNSVFDELTVERKKKRVESEIIGKKSDSEYGRAHERLEAFYGSDSPHLYDIGGDLEVVKNAHAMELQQFYEDHFYASNADLILVGKLPSDIEQMVNTYFGSVRPGEGGKKVELPIVPRIEGTRVIEQEEKGALNYANGETDFYLWMNGPRMLDANFADSMIMKIVLPDVFHNEVSFKKGNCYRISFSAYSDMYRGVFTM